MPKQKYKEIKIRRVPFLLHQQYKILAASTGKSMNELILEVLDKYINNKLK